jgi:hypothetical protein
MWKNDYVFSYSWINIAQGEAYRTVILNFEVF